MNLLVHSPGSSLCPHKVNLHHYYWIPQRQHPRNFQTCFWSSEAAAGRSVSLSVKLLDAEHFVRLITVRWVKRFCWSKRVTGKTPVAIKLCESNINFFCICGTPQYEKVLGTSGPYWNFRWQDLHGVVGIQPSFLARAGVRNSTCHTSFHAACQICGIRHTHTLTHCWFLDWSSVRCARQCG